MLRTGAIASMLSFAIAASAADAGALDHESRVIERAVSSSANRLVAVPSANEPWLLDFTSFVSPADRKAAVGHQLSDESHVMALPPAPDSSTLLLCALGGLGAWQLGASARKWHLAAVPDWFAAHAPDRVGHTTLINLEFTFETIYPYALVRLTLSPILRPTAWAPRHLSDQAVLEVVGPRGPPVL